MPGSSRDGKGELLSFILAHCTPSADILDLGAGVGTYALLLRPRGYTNVDAVEIWERYVERFHLRSLYRTVHVCDALAFKPAHPYDMTILGDILEHLSISDARAMLCSVRGYSRRFVASVPWKYPQGAAYGNDHERHLQPDLTADIMHERYPDLAPLYIGKRKGCYWGEGLA